MATCVGRIVVQASQRNCAFLMVSAQNKLANRRQLATKKLLTVGRLESPKQQGKYVTGQLFLHRIFGYRGILLFPWLARLYDRDVAGNKQASPPLTAETGEHVHTDNKEVKGKTHIYYQVLIDSRDCPFIRAQTEAVTFLGNQDNNRSLYAIPDPNFVAKDTLKAWQEKNHPWLELSDVHRETTENVRVTVIPFYMGARVSQDSSVYWWRYCIRLENLGEETVQLRERHWRIFSLSGTLETVRGRGVIGQEPILSKEQPAFQYSSHVSLQAPSGHMWGTFRIEKSNGQTFDCRIPPFTLESKQDDQPNPHGFFG
ncbi:polymerase delta-interacting protein 2-like isoform X3 [Asterias rubens]|uniref:polymerase delta-interacting protein 2-like isoform X3 n=1 Tax=Asterias rubens TaxID=7604 RepID=UPI001455596D|nr:polymerase delta-interacting protein 2-like isoform X3 [Asterias rubens]